MLGNIIDNRSDCNCPEIDAVFEPSAHDNAQRTNGEHYFDIDDVDLASSGFYVLDFYNTTVHEAIMHAERRWKFAVTVFLYDKGRRPIG
ncbi:hypothetical protein FV219_00465 [Methylobacterium sp. WL122]|nr:hypothetical protein FV219_00465 [Methylobacterium sp. WL122]